MRDGRAERMEEDRELVDEEGKGTKGGKESSSVPVVAWSLVF